MISNPDKIKLIREYSSNYDFGERREYPRYLFDAGSSLGDTAWQLKDDFDLTVTCETSDDMCALRFLEVPNVRVLHGEPSVWINRVVDTIRAPWLFWLDNSFAVEEVLRRPYNHVILLDDDSIEDDDAETLKILLDSYVRGGYPAADFSFKEGIVRITPREEEV